MAFLSYPSPTEVELRLGPHENEILSVVRKVGWWTRAEFEGQVPGNAEVTAVLLRADRAMESTIREILHRSFQIVFPPEGGESEHNASKQSFQSKRAPRA